MSRKILKLCVASLLNILCFPDLKKAWKIFANLGGRGEGSIKFGNFSKIYEQACNSEAHIIFATMRKRVELKLRNFINGRSRVSEEAALHREPGWQFSVSATLLED